MSTTQATLETLRRSDLLSDLQGVELEEVAALARRRTYRRGEVVFHRGDPGDVLHIVCQGRLKVVLPAESGGEAVLAIVGPGGLFGEMALLDGEPRSASVVALERAETAVLGRREFLQLMRRCPSAAERLLIGLVRTIRQRSEEVSDLMFDDLHGRLAKKLVELAEAYGRPAEGSIVIQLPLTQEELAGMVGATRVSVNKMLSFYQDQGMLARRGHQIVVLDLPALRRHTNQY
jgi:CRP/FNR family cyclic AMP-dependent transcriptional regulator